MKKAFSLTVGLVGQLRLGLRGPDYQANQLDGHAGEGQLRR